jgi:hypothetical protein
MAFDASLTPTAAASGTLAAGEGTTAGRRVLTAVTALDATNRVNR